MNSLSKVSLVFIVLIVSSLSLQAQSLDNLWFGTDTTLDVVTWNIEHFPKRGQTTVDYAAQIIKNINAEVYAVQEIEDTIAFREMIEGMDEYSFFIHPGYFAGLAYIYKTDILEIKDIYKIYDAYEYWKPFPRAPVVMELVYNNNTYYVINNHFKCCGYGVLDTTDINNEENRRFKASNLLKEYIDTNLPNEKVIITGDLNDILTDTPPNNVFQAFIDDHENYLFADMNIEIGSNTNWSYPSWPSHLDHLLITNELFYDPIIEDSLVQTIKVDDYFSGGFDTYDYNVSDHRPVGIKIIDKVEIGISDKDSKTKTFIAYPNPANEKITFMFEAIDSNATIEIYLLTGQMVYSTSLYKGQVKTTWNSKNLAKGTYLVKLISKTDTPKTSKIVLQ